MGTRSRLGIYRGHSPCHVGTVALAFNPKTLHVSPQLHVAFNDHFTTVSYLASGDVPPNWIEIVNKSEAKSEDDYDLAKPWLDSKHLTKDYVHNQEGESAMPALASQPETEMNPEGDARTEENC